MVGWRRSSYHEPPIDLKAVGEGAQNVELQDRRMIGGWGGSSSYGSALCASGFEPPMVRWEDDFKVKREK